MRRRKPLRHFLLVFDRDAGKLVETVEFGTNSKQAVAAYDAKEREFLSRPAERRRMEVVLVGSDSLDTIKRTHANYFDSSTTGSKYFDPIGQP